MKKISEWLKKNNDSIVGVMALGYLIWAVVTVIIAFIDFGDKIEGGVVDISFIFTLLCVLFIPFVIGFLFGKVVKNKE